MTYDAVVLADSPAAWWKLADTSGSGTCADSSGGGHTGTPANVTLGVTGPFTNSPSETAGSFNGSSSDVTSSYNPAGLTAFTVEAWVNLGNGNPGPYPRIVANSYAESSNTGLELMLSGGGSGPWYPGAYIGNGTANTGVFSASAVPVTGWHQVAVTWSAGGNVLIYLDGALAATSTGTLSGSMAAGPDGFSVGFQPAYNYDYFAGTIAQVSLYATALSGTRVAAHYAAGTAPGSFAAGASGTGSITVTGHKSDSGTAAVTGTGTDTAATPGGGSGGSVYAATYASTYPLASAS